MSVMAYLSPAKSMRFGPALGCEAALAATEPRLLAKSAALAKAMRAYDAKAIAELMEISPALAELNRLRFLDVDAPLSESDPACRRSAFLFDGDACEALQPESLDASELARLNSSVRFLSGYYGLLRPSDLMRAYRLEMGRRPAGIGAASLYAFWGSSIAGLLAADAEESGAESVLSLASDEYDKAASAAWSSPLPLHRSRFESRSPKGSKVVSFDAKRARGLFARHLAKSSPSCMLEAAEGFSLEGWRLDKAGEPCASGARLWTFAKSFS